MWRSIFSVLAGMVVAMIVVGVLEVVGHLVFPPPPGIDLHDPQQLQAIMDQLPLGALLSVLVAWGGGIFAGGCVAAMLARTNQLTHALIVGGVQMLAGIVSMILIPHPFWFIVASLAIVVPCAWLGARVAAAFSPPPPTAGPRPYDMREKNMAC